MDKVAALTDQERSELFEQTANARGVNPAVIEKDFWVCWVLKKLFASNLATQLVFKGGTSLSKVHKLIDRFSEDIDLVLNWELLGYDKDGQNPWEEQSSNTKQHKFNTEFNQRAQSYIEETLCPLVKAILASRPGVVPTVSDSEGQVINIEYPAAFALEALRPQVKLEIGPLASWVPSGEFTIQPYSADEFGDVFDDPKCPVVAIKAERTFWEKATILHQQFHRTTPMPPAYSRHYYDMFHLANSPVKNAALGDLQLLKDVILFKDRFYRCPWAKYDEAVPGTFHLVPPAEINRQLKTDYHSMQAMIFGEPPEWSAIIAAMGQLENEINELSAVNDE